MKKSMKGSMKKFMKGVLSVLVGSAFAVWGWSSAEQTVLAASNPKTAAASVYDLPMKWKTDAGKAVELKDWSGKWVIISMMYTSCKGSCPLIVQKMKKVEKLLSEYGKKADYILVSFDPDVDTVKKLGDYRKETSLTDPHWTFLTGSNTDARQLSMLLGTKYAKDPESGQIMHDNKILLLNPKGEITARLEELNEDEKLLLKGF